MKKLADIGLIGLAVMGENLVLNMESKGFTVAVFNRTVEKVDKFIKGRGAGKNFIGTHSVGNFVQILKSPRKVMMLVKAGKPVDDFIDQVIPHLEKGDIIIDGGNSHFPDTIRRTEYVESKGFYILEQEFQEEKKVLYWAHQLCLVDHLKHGNMLKIFFSQFRLKLKMEHLAAIGLAKVVPVTLLKWFIMVSNMVICRLLPKHTKL